MPSDNADMSSSLQLQINSCLPLPLQEDTGEQSSFNQFTGMVCISPKISGGFFPEIGIGLSPICSCKTKKTQNSDKCSQADAEQAELTDWSGKRDPRISIICTCRTRCTAKKSCPCKAAGTECSHKCHPLHSCRNTIVTEPQPIVELPSTEDTATHSALTWIDCCGVKLSMENDSVW